MQIVIELDKEDYEKIKKTSFVENTEIMLNQSSEDRKGTMMLFRIIDAIKDGTPNPKGNGRKFEEIVVEYPPAELCTYPEYRGKPYFSIKYEENGEHIIGFGTYKPEVLSRYLQEYFITESEDKK